jgi:hypothetical protein
MIAEKVRTVETQKRKRVGNRANNVKQLYRYNVAHVLTELYDFQNIRYFFYNLYWPRREHYCAEFV